MSIELHCMSCGRNLRVRDQMAGRKVRCPGCRTVMTVPDFVEELPVVEDEHRPAVVEEDIAPPPRPRPRRRRGHAQEERGSLPSWLGPLAFALLMFLLGTACLIIAVNSDYYQFLLGCILCWMLGVFAIMRIFGWSPY